MAQVLGEFDTKSLNNQIHHKIRVHRLSTFSSFLQEFNEYGRIFLDRFNSQKIEVLDQDNANMIDKIDNKSVNIQ